MANWLKVVLIGTGSILFVLGVIFANRIEQTTGYCKCAKCGYKYVPVKYIDLYAWDMS